MIEHKHELFYLLLTWVSGALTWDNMPGMLTLFLCRYFKKTSALRLANVQACKCAERKMAVSGGVRLRKTVVMIISKVTESFSL